MRELLTKLVDWFYFPFIQRYIPRDLFRYAFCGVANIGFEILIYFLCYHFVFDKANWDLGLVVISPHIAALLVSSPIATLTGFWLQKNITFESTSWHSAGQFFRYLMVYGVNLGVNYAGLKLLVDIYGFFPTPSKLGVTLVTVIFSFLMQKYFTFRRPRG